MSVREYAADDSESRQERAEDTSIEDVRVIDGDEFGVTDATVYEVDLVNESGERRENVTIIPSILFENTKDVQHRHSHGIVGKYSRALAMENEQAREELLSGIRQKREQIQEDISDLEETDARLLHTEADLGGF